MPLEQGKLGIDVELGHDVLARLALDDARKPHERVAMRKHALDVFAPARIVNVHRLETFLI